MPSYNLLQIVLENMQSTKKMTHKQQRIVKETIQLFSEKGYAATSTKEIAKAAGVAESTIFCHFGTKENLLYSVIAPFLVEAMSAVSNTLFQEIEASSYNRFEDFLRAVIQKHLYIFKENKELCKVIVSELLFRENLARQYTKLFEESIEAYVDEVFNKYKEREDLCGASNLKIFYFITTYTFGYFTSRVILCPNEDWESKEAVDNMVRFIMNGVKK